VVVLLAVAVGSRQFLTEETDVGALSVSDRHACWQEIGDIDTCRRHVGDIVG